MMVMILLMMMSSMMMIVITRKAYGGAYDVMSSKHLKGVCDVTLQLSCLLDN
jgi:acetyl-CoA carboxylase carboxyltransferase component